MGTNEQIIEILRKVLPKRLKSVVITPEMDLKSDLNIDSLKLVALAIEFSILTGIDLGDLNVDPSSITRVKHLIEIAEKYRK